jgi:AcrR family transcriptional regulator
MPVTGRSRQTGSTGAAKPTAPTAPTRTAGAARAARGTRSPTPPRAAPTGGGPSRPPGRPRDPRLGAAILTAAEQQLGERGYARMSMESVASAAGTTVPSLRRRYRGKPELIAAVIDSLRVEALPTPALPPREGALAILKNFQRNLGRRHAMATLGTIIAEEDRHPAFLEHFRAYLVRPRRAMLRDTLAAGVSAGDLPPGLDLDAAVAMLIGSFYARYLSGEGVPADWPERVLRAVWPVG